MTSFAFMGTLATGLILVVSSMTKGRHPGSFVDVVHRYGLLPRRVGTVFAWALWPIEGALGLMLLFGLATTVALVGAVLLFGLFLIATSVVVRSHRDVPCGCFGDRQEKVSRKTLGRLLGLITLASLILMIDALGAPLPTTTRVLFQPNGVLIIALALVGAMAEIAVGTWLLNVGRVNILAGSRSEDRAVA